MYLINETTKKSIQETMFEASLLLASIPNEILTPEMQEKVDRVIWDLTENGAILNRMQPTETTEETDMREFHTMD
jgi:hypothetical protein